MLHVSTEDQITITGSFFGTKKGKIFLIDAFGKRRKCQVAKKDWTMNAITFKRPKGLSGVYDILVKNKIGFDLVQAALYLE
jgi:hypothetical protein